MSGVRPPYRIRAFSRPGDGLQIRMLRCLGGARTPRTEPRYRAIIFKPERLGDFFLAVKTIRALVDFWGIEQTALVVSPECKALADEEFPRVAQIVIPLRAGVRGWNAAEALRVRRLLKDHSCEHLVSLRHHRQPLASAALRWIPARTRWASRGHPWLPKPTQIAERNLIDRSVAYPWPGAPGVPTEVQAHAALLQAITGVPTNGKDLLPEIRSDVGCIGPPILVVVPWGSGRLTNLDPGLIGNILLALTKRAQVTIRIVSEDRRQLERDALVRDLRQLLPDVDISGHFTPRLLDLRACLARATAVLTADTYPAHLAIALDKPVAVVATGMWPGVFGPWRHSARQRWFTHALPCWGCGSRCIHAKPLCVSEVEPQAVADFLARYFKA